MKNLRAVFFSILAVAIAIATALGSHESTGAEQFKKVLVKFPAFSLGAGEKIVGVEVTVSNGEIVHVFVPRGWVRRLSGVRGTRHVLRCFSPNAGYAITMTGRLPELSIYDMSSITKNSLSIEATVDMEDSSGNAFSKTLSESDLIIL